MAESSKIKKALSYLESLPAIPIFSLPPVFPVLKKLREILKGEESKDGKE